MFFNAKSAVLMCLSAVLCFPSCTEPTSVSEEVDPDGSITHPRDRADGNINRPERLDASVPDLPAPPPAYMNVYLTCNNSWGDPSDACDTLSFNESAGDTIECNLLDESGDGTPDFYQILAYRSMPGAPDEQAVFLVSERIPPGGVTVWPMRTRVACASSDCVGYVHASEDLILLDAPSSGTFTFGNTGAGFHVPLCGGPCSSESWQNAGFDGRGYVMNDGEMFCLWQVRSIPPGLY